jgi:hypothetical protein
MPIERPTNPSCFDFSEREKLYDRISHKRFLEFLDRPDIDVHSVELAVNSLGEYLFVMLSCQTQPAQQPLTFWGLGYHEHREVWIADTWQWYESVRKRNGLAVMEKDDAITQIQEREQFVAASAPSSDPPSARAQLYELIADLTDDDGALNEMEDLDWSLFDFDDPDTM